MDAIRARIAAVVAVGMLTATSCRSLTFLGDSVTGLTARAFHERFDARYTVTVDSRNGATIDDMAATADEIEAAHPWSVVVNLGSNDATAGNPDMVGDYDTLMAKFTAPTCLVAVTLSTSLEGPSFDQLANPLKATSAGRRGSAGGAWSTGTMHSPSTSASGSPMGPC